MTARYDVESMLTTVTQLVDQTATDLLIVEGRATLVDRLKNLADVSVQVGMPDSQPPNFVISAWTVR